MKNMTACAAAALSLLVAAAPAAAGKSGTVVVDPVLDGDSDLLVSRPIVARDVPGYTIAQSFKPVSRQMRFGFRLTDYGHADGVPNNAGRRITYRLYEGENSYKRLVATRHVAFPARVSDDAVRAELGDVGFVEADFSQVKLKKGATYTMRLSMHVPYIGEAPNVWLSWNNPYPDGRLFFPPGIAADHPGRDYYYRRDWSQEDLFFRMSHVHRTVAQQVDALRKWISGTAAIGTKDRTVLVRALDKALSDPNGTGYQAQACHHLDGMLSYIDRHSNRFDDATAVSLFDRTEAIRTGVPCS